MRNSLRMYRRLHYSSKCPKVESLLAIRKWDDIGRFDGHLVAVLRINDRRKRYSPSNILTVRAFATDCRAVGSHIFASALQKAQFCPSRIGTTTNGSTGIKDRKTIHVLVERSDEKPHDLLLEEKRVRNVLSSTWTHE